MGLAQRRVPRCGPATVATKTWPCHPSPLMVSFCDPFQRQFRWSSARSLGKTRRVADTHYYGAMFTFNSCSCTFVAGMREALAFPQGLDIIILVSLTTE